MAKTITQKNSSPPQQTNKNRTNEKNERTNEYKKDALRLKKNRRTNEQTDENG
jgi:hypothetical protein